MVENECHHEKVRNYFKNKEIFSGTKFLTIEGGYPPPKREYITLEEFQEECKKLNEELVHVPWD